MRRVILAVLVVLMLIGAAPRAQAEDLGLLGLDFTKPVSLHKTAPKAVPPEDDTCQGVLHLLDGQDPFELTNSFELAKQGELHNFGVQTTTSGIVLLLAHSGYNTDDDTKQCAEMDRERYQGWPVIDNNGLVTRYSYDSGTMLRQKAALEAGEMTISQEDRALAWSDFQDVVVPNKDVKEFSKNPDAVVSVTIRNMTKAQKAEYDKRLEAGKTPLFYVTCLWGYDTKKATFGSTARFVQIGWR